MNERASSGFPRERKADNPMLASRGQEEPVVPVARATDRFGERRRGCRHRGTRRRIREEPERDQAPQHFAIPRSLVANPSTPLPPPVVRRLERPHGGLRADVDDWFAIGQRQDERQGRRGIEEHIGLLARDEREARFDEEPEHERSPGAQEQVQPPLGPWRVGPEASPRVESDPCDGRGASRFEPSDQNELRDERARHVEHHPLGQLDLRGSRPPRRLEDGRTVAILPDGLPDPVDADGEGTGALAPHEPAEHGVGVESGDAQPVDGALGRAECSCAAVSDEAVVTDRGLRHRNLAA